MFHEVVDFFDTWQYLVNFSQTEEVLVVATADHETGGLGLGDNYLWYPDEVRKVNASCAVMAARIFLGENTEDVVYTYTGITLTDAELEVLDIAMSYNASMLAVALGNIVSGRANIRWTTTAHTGGDVAVYAVSSASKQPFSACIDNTQIPQILADFMGLDLAAATNGIVNITVVGNSTTVPHVGYLPDLLSFYFHDQF